MTEELFYININDPVTLRKTLLESQKGLIDIFKEYDSFMKRKDDRIKLMTSLRTTLNEINELNATLHGLLPDIHVPKQPHKKHAPKQQPTDLAELEASISYIERELEKLG